MKKIQWILHLTIFLGAAVSLVGWISQRATWVVLGISDVPIQFNTALSFLLLSIGLIIQSKTPQALSPRIIGLAVSLMGALTLSEYVLRVSFGLDELFLEQTVTTVTPFPGRMAPATAFAFMLAGAALCIGAYAKRACGWAILLVLCLVMADRFTGGGSHAMPFTLMAPQTLVMFALAGVSLLISEGKLDQSRAKSSNQMPEYFHIGSALLLTILMAFWQLLESDQWERRSQEVRTALDTLSNDLEFRLQERGRALWRFADRWSAHGGLTREQWETGAARFIQDFPDIEAIVFAEPDFIVRWRISRDPTSVLPEGTSLGTDQGRQEAFAAALINRRPFMMPFLDLRSGGRGTTYTIPIFDNDRHVGFLNASLPSSSILSGIGGPLFDGFEVALLDDDRLEVGHLPSENDLGALLLQETRIEAFAQGWELALWPNNEYLTRQATQIPQLVLAFGLLAGFLTSVLVWANQNQILERLRAQDDARIANEIFHYVAQATSDVIWDWELSRDHVWWSEGLASAFGYSGSDVKPTGDWRMNRIHPDDQKRVQQSLKDVVDGADLYWTSDYRFERSDGQFSFVEDSGVVIRDQKGKAVRMVGSISDVSERLDLEQRLQQAQKMEAVGQLTGGVAHDFNNLLTVIIGNAEMLSEELSDKPRLRRLAEMTVHAADRGAELTSRLLAFARKQPLSPRVLDLGQLISEIDPLLRRTLPENVEIELVRAGGLWKAEVDAAQMESAILNLALNARDAMIDGGQLTIEVANAMLDDEYAAKEPDVKVGQYVVIIVSDTGHGMSADVVARVFEPFFTTKEMGKGSGLGLSMVYGFVKQSGGHIRVYSEQDEGTSFKLYFPRYHATTDVVQILPTVNQITGGQETILVVEDDSLVRDHVMTQLKNLGYRVLGAPAGGQALEIIKATPEIDLLFTDVMMPGGIGGRSLADAARLIRPDLKILFTSGYTENSIVHHGRLDAGVDLLSKPYRRDQLAAKVRSVLDADRST